MKILLVENWLVLRTRLRNINSAIPQTFSVVQTNDEGDARCYRLWIVA